VRAVLLQLRTDLAEPREARVARVTALVREQRGADLVVLPELWPTGAFHDTAWEPSAEALDGPTVTALAAAAADLGAYVHMGSLVERAGGALHNTSVLLGPDGAVLASYRKVHRFGFAAGERRLLTAGTDVVVHDAGPLGRWALATCYDLRFPELFRAAVDRGAEVLLLVAGWPAARIAHWSLLARARAVEDQLLVLACNAVGDQGVVSLGGRSVVVDPWGEVLAEAGDDEQVVAVDVDVSAVARVRRAFPVLRDRVLT
jgi:predicted amidohydrolase